MQPLNILVFKDQFIYILLKTNIYCKHFLQNCLKSIVIYLKSSLKVWKRIYLTLKYMYKSNVKYIILQRVIDIKTYKYISQNNTIKKYGYIPY